MDDIKGIRTPRLNNADPRQLREQIRHYFHQTYTIDEKLYDSLADDSVFYLRADPLRHPLVFYLGHTAAFYINKLNIGRVINERVNPAFESMFAVGVDEMSWDDLNEANYNWPAIPEVRAYRDAVRAYVDALITNMPLDDNGITWDSPWWAIIMGIEHQRIHLETSSVLIRQLPLDKVKQLYFWPVCTDPGRVVTNELLPLPGGKVKIGRGDDNPYYGWDNEYGCAEYEVAPFSASRYLVSNAEFMDFVRAGGYAERKYWTEEGWAWRCFRNAGHPLWWIAGEGDTWSLRLMACEIPMPWAWPVEVNYLEAKAFCNWKSERDGISLRLPSEEEWYHLRDTHLPSDQPEWDKAPGNINLEHYSSSCPVDEYAFGEFYDVVGNVWQWTETPIYALPGFRIHPYYDDFSVPTFDGRHNLIKGGSWISTGNEALRNSRYAFRRHFFQHAGFRYIHSDAEAQTHDDPYESDADIIKWCDADWGDHPFGARNFSEDLVDLIDATLPQMPSTPVLDIGCRTGRSTFELARYCDNVIGTDFTARLIRMATDMKERGFIRYLRKDEGQILTYLEKHLDELCLDEFAPHVEFWQADPSNLKDKFAGYGLVLAREVMSEGMDPKRFLELIRDRILPQGYLVIVDHYERADSSADDIGGYRKDGEPYSYLEGLQAALEDAFIMLSEPQELWQPVRDGARVYTLHQMQITFWQKR